MNLVEVDMIGLQAAQEASHCSITCLRWLPAALGSSSSMRPCTFVASTMLSRFPLRLRASLPPPLRLRCRR